MKKIIILGIVLSSITLINCKEKIEQTPERLAKIKNDSLQNSLTKTSMAIDVKEHDFGDIPYEEPVKATFKVRNTGDNPLIISSAKASCGCTVPTKPEQPIAPGEEDIVEAVYTPNKEGHIEKTIDIYANITGDKLSVKIKANVLPKKTQ